MRPEFFKQLHKVMGENPNIWALTGDLGFGGFNNIQKDFPDRFVNCGASEQAMMGIAVGLALKGKIPFVYSITPFLLYRAFETIRNYIDHEKVPVILIGSGRDDDYKHDGFSHFAGDDKLFIRGFNNIQSFWPKDTDEMIRFFNIALKHKAPYYINLKR